MSKVDSKGGLSIAAGLEYQLYYAISYFLHHDISEIMLEWKDEDIVIINEDKELPSLGFI